MARLDRRASLRLLEAAYDSGIRHFDVARAYGYGEAEEVVGELWRRHADITVPTKCGIEPPPRDALARLKPLVRRAASWYPPLRAAARARAQQMVTRGAFSTGQTAPASSAVWKPWGPNESTYCCSHECRAADMTPELLAWLHGEVDEGRIGAFGTATDAETTRSALATGFTRVLQVPHALTRPGAPPAAELVGREIIVHSILRDLQRVEEVLERHPDLRAPTAELAAEVTGDPHDVGGLLVAATAADRPDALVLVASRQVGRILRTVRAVETGLPSDGMQLIQRLVKVATLAVL
jgi:hypothetical protein